MVTEAGKAERFGLGGLVGLALGAGLVGGAWLVTGDGENPASSPAAGAKAVPGGGSRHRRRSAGSSVGTRPSWISTRARPTGWRSGTAPGTAGAGSG